MCDDCKSCVKNDWIALVYKLPAIPSKFRVKVWREMKKYGAIYLQQSVAVLPNSASCTQVFENLRETIVSYSGEATLINFRFSSEKDATKAYEAYNSGLCEEFNLIEAVREKILCDLESAKEANLLTLSDLNEKLSALKKLKRNYNSIMLRDCYKQFISEPFERHLNDLIVRVCDDIKSFEDSVKTSGNE